MIRSLINNERIPPLQSGEVGKSPVWEYYRNLFWEMRNLGSWGKSARAYRVLRHAITQYQVYRDKVQAFTSIEQLMTWINSEQFEVYACPLNILIDTRTPTAYEKVTIDRVAEANISTKFRHDDYTEEDVDGDGWTFELLVYPNKGRFNINCLLLGLAAYGVYATEQVYDSDSQGQTCYRLTCSALARDFKFTDAADARWAYNPALDDDPEDDEDLEDLISEEESRARWFEEGYSDDEIDGLFDGYR